jgi:NTE family protein
VGRVVRIACVATFMLLSPAIPSPAPAQSERPRTCLVLGGGGARGAAHIGVLKVLERERIPIDCVVGTSMGAVVGGLYAAGYDAGQIEAALNGIDWNEVFHDEPPRAERAMRRKEDDLRFLGGVEFGLGDGKIRLPQGMIQGQKLLLVLRRLLLSSWDVTDFDELPIPYRCVAADIENGEKVVFGRGDLAIAIRSSMSVPGVFEPVRVDGRLLVDGGMLDNVPVDEGRKLGAERLIVVEVGSPLHSDDELGSPLGITSQVISVLMRGRTDAQLASLGPQDLLLVPDLKRFKSSDFEHSRTAIEIGYAAAERAAHDLRRFAVSEAEYAQFQARHKARPFDEPLVSFLDVQRQKTHTSRYVEQRLQHTLGRELDVNEIEKQVGIAYGEGRYENIRWQLEQREENKGVRVDPTDKEWGPNFVRVGLRLSDDLRGRSSYQLLSEISFTGLNEYGGEARTRVDLGRVTDLFAEFHQPWGLRGRFALAPYLEYRAFDVPVPDQGQVDFLVFRRSDYRGGLELSMTPDNQWRVSVALERGYSEGRLRVGDASQVRNIAADTGSIQARIEFDTLDTVGFPAHGTRFDLSQEELLESLGSDQSAHVSRLSWDKALSFGAHRFVLGLKGVYADGGEDLLGARGALGGLTNLSGFRELAELAPYTGLARIIYYRAIGGPEGRWYAGGSLERGGAWQTKDEISLNSTVAAGSLFVGMKSFMGPLFLGYGRAEHNIDAFYLRLGPLLQPETEF